ncbi:MAG: tRNA dihydrouridine synthase DusB [Paludibacteraceae bacterium]|nr:tRNA dihydrouridine synthase DusB [Paludibacteraceae bacterium]
MKIGNVEFGKEPLFLAPMEDVTDPAFRLLCKRFGADMVYTEFVSADALIRNVKRTEQKLTIHDEERPVAIQIYGKDVDTMVEAAKIVEEAGPDILDLNFGCPVKKVAGKGAGSGMLRDVPKLLAITKAVVEAVKIPVTVKTRLGWDENSKIIVDLAEAIQDCGAQALAIHGRTRAQMYTGEADWTLIGEVKNNPRMRIPIIGNGDVTTPERARECFDRYGVDAVMIGRGAIGRPWIFEEVKHYLQTGEYVAPYSMQWQIDIIKEHVLRSIEWLGDERKGIVHSRRHLAVTPVFKGIDHFKPTRIAMLRAESLEELFGIIDSVPGMVGMRNEE